jgi:hypothetical protein
MLFEEMIAVHQVMVTHSVCLRPLHWTSFTCDTMIICKLVSPLFGDISWWYLHHLLEFAIRCCWMQWDTSQFL